MVHLQKIGFVAGEKRKGKEKSNTPGEAATRSAPPAIKLKFYFCPTRQWPQKIPRNTKCLKENIIIQQY